MERSNNSSSSSSSSSVSESEQEKKDGASRSMMMSEDVGSWGRTISVGKSSDSNSDVLVVKSEIIEKRDGNFDCGGKEAKEMKIPREKEQELYGSDNGNDQFGTKRSETGVFESGVFRDMIRKVESDISDDGYECDDEFDSNIDVSHAEFLGGETGYGISDEELCKDLCKESSADCPDIELMEFSKMNLLNCSDTELRRGSTKETKSNQVDAGLGNCTRSKRVKDHDHDFELGSESLKKMRFEISEKSIGTYVSTGPTADEKLNSHEIENLIGKEGGGESSSEQMKIKEEYKCPFCFRLFSSDQVLRDHMKSH
ncbi:uncharacterized protein LOC143892108 [Tasmannia lanceolata]|uniref:uncharacterized protein LOC143892108 n=1 Tax=Tasmannia lanceolata TaxID=3420 RepID=UPI0040647A93